MKNLFQSSLAIAVILSAVTVLGKDASADATSDAYNKCKARCLDQVSTDPNAPPDQFMECVRINCTPIITGRPPFPKPRDAESLLMSLTGSPS